MRALKLTALLAASVLCCTEPAPIKEAPLDVRKASGVPLNGALSLEDATGAVHYTLRFDNAKNHYIEVQAVFPAGDRDALTVMMPVWTPGSYLVREFIRNVEGFEAVTLAGAPLPFEKVRKNRYRIQTEKQAQVVLRYRLYGREATVRTNFVDSHYAILNGAAVFFAEVERLDQPFSVKLILPPGWSRSVTGLSPHPDGASDHYLAPDFDTLVDSPILLGNPKLYSFKVGGRPHLLANSEEGGVWNGPRSAKDVQAIVSAQLRFWRKVPYKRYVFLNVINEARGGLEHSNSTLMMTSRFTTRSEEAYRGWLGLVSHEFFHTWNGKRLRPAELGPFDYEREVYTKDLWIVEGLTSYYDDLLLVRAGLMARGDYLDVLTKNISRLQRTPGRARHALDMTSYDAWIKFYRGDENSMNSTVSYYNKGAVVGFLLDAEIRRATREKSNLDDVMRAASAKFSGDVGYSTKDFYDTVESIAGRRVRRRLVRMVSTTRELNYAGAFDWYGLEFVPQPKDPNGPQGDEKRRVRTDLGVEVSDGPKVMIQKVHRDSSAWDAGLNVGDELIAIDGYRILKLPEALQRYEPGDTVDMTIARRGKLEKLRVRLGEIFKDRWKVQRRSAAPSTARRRFDALLSGR